MEIRLANVHITRRLHPGDRLRGALGHMLGEHVEPYVVPTPAVSNRSLTASGIPSAGRSGAGEEDRHPMIIGRRPSTGSVPATARSRQARPRALPPISAAPARSNLVPADRVPNNRRKASKRKSRRSNSALRVGQPATVRSDAQRTAPGKENGSHPTPIEPSGHHWSGNESRSGSHRSRYPSRTAERQGGRQRHCRPVRSSLVGCD